MLRHICIFVYYYYFFFSWIIVSVRPYNPVDSVFVVALHVIAILSFFIEHVSE